MLAVAAPLIEKNTHPTKIIAALKKGLDFTLNYLKEHLRLVNTMFLKVVVFQWIQAITKK